MNITALILGQVAYMVQLYADQYLQEDRSNFLRTKNFDTFDLPEPEYFDFIIGAGTAGCLLANRLQAASHTILLLEIGGDPPPQSNIPFLAPNVVGVDDYVFKYESVHQKHAAQQTGGIVTAYTGKAMGGTSSVNYGIINRGHPYDFDNWANITGDPSWTYTNMLRYFKKFENYGGAFPSDANHGIDGPVTISSQGYAPGSAVMLAAGGQMGFLTGLDPNGPQPLGFTPVEYSKKFGRRVSSYTAFIRSNESSVPTDKLEIRRYSKVEEILINNDKTAFGVRYTQHGFPKIAHARNEVIVSAGTYGSPQLLLRSGIGPEEDLSALNIPIVANLPVGKNLQEHAYVALAINVTDVSPSNVYIQERDLTQEAINDFLSKGEGVLTGTVSRAAQSFLSSSVTAAEGHPYWPDIQFTLLSEDFLGELGNKTKNSKLQEEHTIYMYVYLGRPKSFGQVSLDPKNIHGPPLIDFQLLNDERDVQIFIDGIKMALRLFEETNAYRQIGAKYSEIPVKLCEHEVFRSDTYWRCYLRVFVNGGYHPASTCPMGKVGDSNAVLDSNLRVIGIRNLRVIDASVMPVITNANLQAPVYAIAEKLCEGIIKDWKF